MATDHLESGPVQLLMPKEVVEEPQNYYPQLLPWGSVAVGR